MLVDFAIHIKDGLTTENKAVFKHIFFTFFLHIITEMPVFSLVIRW